MKRITAAPSTIGPVGPYSQAVVSGNLVFTAGQIPARNDFDTQPESFEEQVRQTLNNLENILIAAGSDFNHVIKVNSYLTDPAQLQPFNRIYAEILGHAPPARTTVCVSLWDVALEIDCVAELICHKDPK
ncbi:RidA family protein [Pseudomonas syringae]|uniref:L-PSP family endoribonuclease n=1 Tax=Pseudomonas syringae pv. aceris TaxID=199198 RepID=A0A0L8IX92_PSESX|nr:RidA family protein [Pseudomonas syringae]EGH72000.1 L-PSP family endoribonuclease [Pseudomonas syringae pv. aceris str. M302273]KOG06021.1 L-PSP family endoribonuclease [Pseudomonas syringae pv. aceris]KPW21688.1 L-PSP family endoribonuclease [Pseudomonas syringae pv. aceris]MCF8984590.1 RidA family protein [Pseudomonas syringae]MCF9004968.1 RidA family protein [Pseudomonas syringae]